MIKVGDIIDNRYSVLSHLGTGGMAVVFKCDDIINSRPVALKILKEELLGDKTAVSNFTKEVKASVSMVHPNIVEIYEEGNFEGRPYLVMEYLKDQTLLDKLEYFTKFSVKETCEIMLQLLDAISYTHKHGIIHRDIKPQNVFYLPNGTIKLADFGIASNQKEAGNDKDIIGSVHYLAPEVITKKVFSISSDIYATGITFYQLITGRLPFDGSTSEVATKQVKNEFPKPSLINSLVPSQIDEIILKATKKSARARYRDSNEFKKAIQDYLDGKIIKKSFFGRIF